MIDVEARDHKGLFEMTRALIILTYCAFATGMVFDWPDKVLILVLSILPLIIWLDIEIRMR